MILKIKKRINYYNQLVSLLVFAPLNHSQPASRRPASRYPECYQGLGVLSMSGRLAILFTEMGYAMRLKGSWLNKQAEE